MADTLSYELVTPRGKFAGEGVLEIYALAETGEIGIMPGHDVMVLLLGTGPIKVVYPDRKEFFFCSKGYIQIENDEVLILSEICETKDEIDVERAKKSKERAEKRLKDNPDDLDWVRAEASLKRAIQRTQVAEIAD